MPKKRKRGRPVGSHKPEVAGPVGPTKNAIPPTPETVIKAIPPFLDVLPPELKVAAIKIEAAYLLRYGSLKTASSQFERRIGKAIDGETIEKHKEELEQAYVRWQHDMTVRRIWIKPVIQMVVDGIPPYEIDRMTHMASGWAAERLIEGLSLFVTKR